MSMKNVRCDRCGKMIHDRVHIIESIRGVEYYCKECDHDEGV